MKWDVVLYLIFMIIHFCTAFLETRGCNRTVRNSVGWIRWTGRMGKCIIQIKTPSKDPQIIELRIRRLQVGILKNSKCEGAYIQFFENSDIFKDDSGRYCGHITSNTTRLFLKRGPDLTLVMNSETNFAAKNPVIFSAQYSILPSRLANERHRGVVGPAVSECPLECRYRNDRRTCRLVSPGYPGVYPRGIRCRVSLESSTGRFRIGGSEDLYSLMNYTHQDGCYTENCQDFFEPDSSSSLETKSSYFPAARSINIKPKEDEDENESRPQVPKASTTRTRVITPGRKTNGNTLKIDENLNSNKLKHNGIIRHRHSELRTKTKSFESNRFRHEGHFKEKRISFGVWNPFNSNSGPLPKGINENRDKNLPSNNESSKFTKSANPDSIQGENCLGDYLALLENINGKILEITKFCGEGRIPQILSRGRNIIIEFFASNDGTIMHDGFHLTLQEIEATKSSYEKNCEFLFKSSDKSREIIKSVDNWYPPRTFCTYKFLGKVTEKVSIQLKIIRNALLESNDFSKKNNTKPSVHCTGNEITIYNGAYENNNLMLWSFCDSTNSDINNIQVPIISSGNSLMVQFFSSKGSFDGQEFTYTISYKFIKKSHNITRRRQIKIEETKLISLRPVDFSVLNLNETEICDCDISDRIGSFKSWFMVLVVLGVISFLGAMLTIVALLTKWMKMRATEKSLLQTPK
ncbi:uncharacterized protein LOC122500219 isoform X2 [Leptopilina heterotoma]|uniref:uncharacterized protein LOC122500219 isoform X2 n=1 Tax=Leptopilina heterotoma TaxID=63436 RepID=UPI001CA9388D|nr:uncharacterized protein LOC122500219 isoform X2 [Leptopilina heterotoma]